MKNLSISLLCLTSFLACQQDECSPKNEMPACIEDRITPGSQMDTSILAVKRIKVGNEMHYWLNTGHLAFDGPEYIVNAACDTVCFFCFCPPKDCWEDYDDDAWEVIWEK